MSEELLDEVEAINSIYGDGSLVPSSDEADDNVYILKIPNVSSTFRLQFPRSYPAEPPAALGTDHSADKRGVATMALEVLRRALGTAFQPGQVCLFDTINEVAQLLGADAEEEEDNDEGTRKPSSDMATRDVVAGGVDGGPHDDDDDVGDADLGPAPDWTLSEPTTELKSTFLARCCRATSPDEAARAVAHLLATDRRARAATHNISAWRIRGGGGGGRGGGVTYQDSDDDGETAAGARVLRLMQLMDLWDVVVVVTRWYGGHKLGPRRFAIINAVARDAFVKAGLVKDGEEKGQAGKRKGQHGR